ncbi:MAG: hypothetical protein ACRDL6_12155 [Solirubrobacterales bacterium]
MRTHGSELTPPGSPLTVVLELAPNRKPVEGSARSGQGEPLAFIGWMELVAALESMLEEASPPLSGSPDPIGEEREALS